MKNLQNTDEICIDLMRIAEKIADDYESKTQSDYSSGIVRAIHQIRRNTIAVALPSGNIIRDAVEFLTDQKIDFAVIGGMALTVHGQARATGDIDFLVSSMPDSVDCGDPRYMEKFQFYRAKSSTGTTLTVDSKRNGQIELLLANNEMRRLAISTAGSARIAGVDVPVVSAAALIGLKIQAYTNNPSRKQDRPDILSVLESSNPDLSDVTERLSEEELAALNKILQLWKD